MIVILTHYNDLPERIISAHALSLFEKFYLSRVSTYIKKVISTLQRWNLWVAKEFSRIGTIYLRFKTVDITKISW